MPESSEPRLALFGARLYTTAEIQFAEPKPVRPTGSYSLLLVFLCLLYTNLTLLVPSLDDVRPVQLVGMCALLLLFVELTLSRRGIYMLWPESYLFLAFLGAAVLSCFTALWMRLAVISAADLAKMAAIYFVMVNSIDTETRLRGVIWTMILGGLAPAVGTIRNHLNGVLIEGTRAAWIGIFGNPNEVAYALVVLVPLVFLLGTTSSRRLRLLAWAVLPVFATAIYLSFSRGGLIGLAAVLVLIGLRQRSRFLSIFVWVLLIGGVFLTAHFWSREEGFTGVSQDLTFQQRIATIRAGLQMFLDYPLLGVGIGCSVVGWPLYAPENLYTRGSLVNHNTFVQALSETGVLGFIPFALLLISSLNHTRKMARTCAEMGKEPSVRLATALEISLLGFLVCGMSGGYLLTWFPYLLFGLTSCAARLTALDTEAAGESRSPGEEGYDGIDVSDRSHAAEQEAASRPAGD